MAPRVPRACAPAGSAAETRAPRACARCAMRRPRAPAPCARRTISLTPRRAGVAPRGRAPLPFSAATPPARTAPRRVRQGTSARRAPSQRPRARAPPVATVMVTAAAPAAWPARRAGSARAARRRPRVAQRRQGHSAPRAAEPRPGPRAPLLSPAQAAPHRQVSAAQLFAHAALHCDLMFDGFGVCGRPAKTIVITKTAAAWLCDGTGMHWNGCVRVTSVVRIEYHQSCCPCVILGMDTVYRCAVSDSPRGAGCSR